MKKTHAPRLNALFAIVLLIILLCALRLALPSIVERYVNRQLHSLDHYTGHVEHIHIALWRGAYDIENIVIEKRGAKNNEAFLAADHLQIALQWRAILHGSVVGHAHFERARLNLIQSDDTSQQQLGEDNNWNDALAKLFPFTFNEISGDDSTIRFRAPGIERKQALVLHDVHFSVKNLTNVFPAGDQAAFADFELNGHALGQGVLKIRGKLNPAKKTPTFEVTAQLKEVAIPELNPWLDTYVGVNAEAGTFSVYTEFAAADGKFKGYVKPIIKDIKVITPPGKAANIFHRMWSGLVEIAATIFKNQPHDQLATRIPFSGTIENPDADVFTTAVNILRNAFINAFSNSLEHSVNLDSMTADPKRQHN